MKTLPIPSSLIRRLLAALCLLLAGCLSYQHQPPSSGPAADDDEPNLNNTSFSGQPGVGSNTNNDVKS